MTTTIEQQARERVNNSKALSQHEATIFYDWPNWDEHMEWIATADAVEIVEWARTVSGKSLAAVALRAIPSAKRAAASRANGKRGGRPRS